MRQQRKYGKVLAAAVLLAMGMLALPQIIWAATAVSGVGTTDETKNSVNTGGASANGGEGATAVGEGANAGYIWTTAIGYKASATYYNAIAIGHEASSIRDDCIAIGTNSAADRYRSIAIGYKALVKGSTWDFGGSFGVAIGHEAWVYGNLGIAMGYNANASENAVAIGGNASVTVKNGVAIGLDAVAIESRTDTELIAESAEGATMRTQTVSFGHKNGDTYYKANQNGGYDTKTYSTTVRSRLINVADGVSDTDAATVGQLNAAVLAGPYAIESGSTDALTVTKGDKKWTIKANTAPVSDGVGTLVTGGQVYTYVSNLTGNASTDVANESEKLVTGNAVYNYVNNLIGGEVTTGSDKSGKLVTGAAVASAIDEAKTTIAADTAKLISYDKDTSTIKIGAGDGITADSVSVGDRKITGVATGKDDTDAVNVSQMNSAISAATSTLNTTIGEKLAEDGNVILKDNSVTGNISALDTKIGKVADGTYKVISASNTISENLIALDKAVGEGGTIDVSNLKTITRADSAEASGTDAIALGTDAKAAGENAIAFGTGSVVTGTNSIAVGTGHQVSGNNSGAFGDPTKIDGNNSYSVGNNNTVSTESTFVLGNNVTKTSKNSVILGDGSEATEDNVVSVGSETNPRKIVNVAAGENDTDAVNVGQFKEAMNGTVLGFNQVLQDLDSRVNKVGAGAAALAALHPVTYNPEDKMSFAVGYGHYKNANAGAFGAFFRPNEDVMVSVGSTFGNGNSMMNAGVSFKLGQRGKRLMPTDAGAVQRLMMENASQAKQIEALSSDNEKIKADNAKLKADNEKMQAQIAMILEKMNLSETVEKSAG